MNYKCNKAIDAIIRGAKENEVMDALNKYDKEEILSFAKIIIFIWENGVLSDSEQIEILEKLIFYARDTLGLNNKFVKHLYESKNFHESENKFNLSCPMYNDITVLKRLIHEYDDEK